MKSIRIAAALVLPAALLLQSSATVAAGMGDHADVVRNDPSEGTAGGVLLTAENSVIERTADGFTVTLAIPTPEPGSYVYPEGIPPERWAYPEVFTGWAAVFNHPEKCTTSQTPPFCGAGDRNDDVKFGMYHFAGHLSSLTVVDGEIVPDLWTDGMVVLTGTIELGAPQRPDLPSGVVTYPLENPQGAEVHALIAPHGRIDHANYPAELYDPTGNSKCGCRWIAYFSPSA